MPQLEVEIPGKVSYRQAHIIEASRTHDEALFHEMRSGVRLSEVQARDLGVRTEQFSGINGEQYYDDVHRPAFHLILLR